MSPSATKGTPKRTRRPTATTNFGSGRRESHDASHFYDRFTAPELSTDEEIGHNDRIDVIHQADARAMTAVATNSVALVVTSPPYFAGKQYEEALGVDGVPADYFDYLGMLRDVFAECARVLEPGGRIAVNVANLGRRPYRSLAGDVTDILSELGLLLRGEVIWWKGRAAGGSCAWGTFQQPANPVLRDVTERIVIAGKGRFDRALTPAQRAERDLPSTATISRDEFMAATTDLWEIAPESATRVGHPAPFPVALPQRLVELFTYAGDVVLDPFMGSGSTAVAAVRTGRHFIGFDTDADYIAGAETRVADERALLADGPAASPQVAIPAGPSHRHTSNGPDNEVDDEVARLVRQGHKATDAALALIEACGFTEIRTNVKPRGLGICIDVVASDHHGDQWAFDVSGGFTTNPTGLRRSDTLWKALATAGVFAEARRSGRVEVMPLVLMTTDKPVPRSVGHKALAAMTGVSGGTGTAGDASHPVFDVIDLLDPDDRERLRHHATHGRPALKAD